MDAARRSEGGVQVHLKKAGYGCTVETCEMRGAKRGGELKVV
jgi:hypothetical protein